MINIINHVSIPESGFGLCPRCSTDDIYKNTALINGTKYKMINIISGPSCSGKSAFLQRAQTGSITDLPLNCPIYFPGDISNKTLTLNSPCYVHYNLLRLADHRYRKHDHQIDTHKNFILDSPWNIVCDSPAPKQAMVLLASRSVLKERMLSRKYDESLKLKIRWPRRYPSNNWLAVLESVDLEKLYLNWCAELRQRGISYKLVNSESQDFELVEVDKIDSLRLNT